MRGQQLPLFSLRGPIWLIWAWAGRKAVVENLHDRAARLRVWTPWVILSAFVFIWGLPPVKAGLNSVFSAVLSPWPACRPMSGRSP